LYNRNVYVVQPYRVGTKDRKSLAIVIPAQVVKEYSFSTSTIFALKVDNMRRLTLQNVGAVAYEEQPTNMQNRSYQRESIGADSI
jgi:antitoxin component of MazEF toxin-antitoxin module